MEKIIEALQNYDANEKQFKKSCLAISKDIKDGNYEILSLIESLKEYLTSEEPQVRSRGLHVLSAVIELTPQGSLNDKQLTLLSTYYREKLGDHWRVIAPAVQGVLAILKHNNLNRSEYVGILEQIFHNVSCQSQSAEVRLKIYEIFRIIVENRPNDLVNSESSFVLGVISAIDGERDPRNLLFLFRWLPEFIKTLKLDTLTDEMFDVVSCYFPVDFRVHSEEANGISRDALAEALAPCLVATEDFADFCLPLIVEKLQSTHETAQLDSIKLLNLSFQIFAKEKYIRFDVASVLIDFLLKKSTFDDLSLETLTKLTNKLVTSDEDFAFLDKHLQRFHSHLTPSDSEFEKSWKFLLALTKASQITCNYLRPKIQDTLINVFNLCTNSDEKVQLLLVLKLFLKVSHSFGESNNKSCEEFLKRHLLNKNGEKKIWITILDIFCELSMFIGKDLREVLYKNLREEIVSQKIDGENSVFKLCLLKYSQQYEEEVKKYFLDLLKDNIEHENFENLLWNLSFLCHNDQFLLEFVSQLEKNFSKNRKVCLTVLKNALDLGHDTLKLREKLRKSSPILNEIMNVENISKGDSEDLQNNSEILMNLMSSFNLEQQSFYVKEYLQVHWNKTLKNPQNFVEFYAGFLVMLHREILEDFSGLIPVLFQLESSTSTQLMANLVNKLPNEIIDKYVEKFFKICSGGYNHENKVIWLTKALVMKGHHSQDKWIDLLFNYTKNSSTGRMGFSIIMNEDIKFLSALSHCQKRLFYKQYFFEKICEKYYKDFVAEDPNYYLGFSELISHVPMLILKVNFNKKIRLILLTMDNSNESSSIIAILKVIKTLLDNDDELGSLYFSELLPRLGKLTKFKTMQVRILSIDCISKYANQNLVSLPELLREKGSVLNVLGDALDDSKRLVRKEAVQARLKWYLLGAPI